jgi:hypothetical protein
MVAVVLGYYTLLPFIYLSIVGLMQVKTMPLFENQSKYAAVSLLCGSLIDKAITVQYYMCE